MALPLAPAACDSGQVPPRLEHGARPGLDATVTDRNRLQHGRGQPFDEPRGQFAARWKIGVSTDCGSMTQTLIPGS